MVFNSKRNVSEEQNERHKRILTQVLKEEGNKTCADCKTRNPTWASVNLGVFVCLTCSGIHRSLGVHISQVRSCNLDTWLPKQVEFCKTMGNVKGNRYWEARLPNNFRRPPSGNPNPELASFIRGKYVDRVYAATDVAEPPTIDNYSTHSYARDDSAASSSADVSGSATTSSAPPAAIALAQPRPAGVQFVQALPAQSPPPPQQQLTTDLLGGFDELLVSSSASTCPPPPATAALPGAQGTSAADIDPFDLLAAGTSSSAMATQPLGRVSLDWTDFHGPSSSAVSSSNAASGHSSQVHGNGFHAAAVADPFATFVNTDLVSQLQTTGIASQSQPTMIHHQQSMSQPGGHQLHATSSKHASAKSADEILKLFDAPGGQTGSMDFGAWHAPAGGAHMPQYLPMQQVGNSMLQSSGSSMGVVGMGMSKVPAASDTLIDL